MDECVFWVLALAVLAYMGIELTRDFSFASWDDEGGPVRVECKFEGSDFQVRQVSSGTEQIVSKGSAADDPDNPQVTVSRQPLQQSTIKPFFSYCFVSIQRQGEKRKNSKKTCLHPACIWLTTPTGRPGASGAPMPQSLGHIAVVACWGDWATATRGLQPQFLQLFKPWRKQWGTDC